MATQAEIAEVLGLLGPNAASDGWDEAKINDLLDEGNTPDEIALEYWEARMAKTSTMVNVTESGSSRSLRDVFTNASAMAKYFADKNKDDETESSVRPVRTRSIKRV